MNLIYQIIFWKNILLATGGESDDLICISNQDTTSALNVYEMLYNEIKAHDSRVIESKRMSALRHTFFRLVVSRQIYDQSAKQSLTLYKTTRITFFAYAKSFARYVQTIMSELCRVCDSTKNHSVDVGDVLEDIRNYEFTKNQLKVFFSPNTQTEKEELVKVFLMYVPDLYVVYHKLNTYIKKNISKCDNDLQVLMVFLLNLNYFIIWMHESVLNTDFNVEDLTLMNMIWTIDHENLRQLMCINRKVVSSTSFNLLYKDGIVSKDEQGNINFTQIYQNWSESM